MQDFHKIWLQSFLVMIDSIISYPDSIISYPDTFKSIKVSDLSLFLWQYLTFHYQTFIFLQTLGK